MMAATPVILHVDMDAFYASIELARNPHLRERPMWVGGASRGVVLSANYLARASGVRSGMSSTRARRLCPAAVAIAPDFDTYSAVSKGIFAIFRTVTAQVEAASIDEAFLDLTGALRRLGGDAAQVGEQLRAQVADEQGIACSVGIGPNKFVAKLASKQAKPDGLVQVRPEQVVQFLHPLPVEAMWGVGESTASALHRLGLLTVADLAHTPRDTLQRAFGNQGKLLHDLAWGRDTRPVMAAPMERSIGSQETFAKDTDDPDLIATELLRMSARTASRMRMMGVLGRTVTISLRFADFTTITRTSTMPGLTDVTDEIYACALKTYGRLNLQRARIRRVGVRVEGLVDLDDAYQQLPLDAPDRGMREAERAADAAVHRFGPYAVRRASLTTNERRRPPRQIAGLHPQIPAVPSEASQVEAEAAGGVRDDLQGWTA